MNDRVFEERSMIAPDAPPPVAGGRPVALRAGRGLGRDRVVFPLLLAVLIALVGMTVFEVMERAYSPQWIFREPHTLLIFLGAAASAVAAGWMLHRDLTLMRLAAGNEKDRIAAERDLVACKDRLEETVAERTAALERANGRLENEIHERKEIKAALQQAHDRLEDTVIERTFELRRTIEALRVSTEEWQRTFDAIGESVLILKPDLTIVRANKATGDVLGAAPKALVGRRCCAVVHCTDDPIEGCPTAEAIRGRRVVTREFHEPRLKRWFAASSSPIFRDGEVTEIVHIARDITERKETQEQLRHAQKMEAVGILAGGVAHDFNNMLSVILGYSEMLCSDEKLHERWRPKIQEIRRAGMRAADLTRQLLAFSRRQVLSPQAVNLNEVIASMKKMLPRLIGEDIELRTVAAPAIQDVMVDPGQIEQVIMNLTVNARDAMPHGGTLTIETANVVLDEAYAREHVGTSPGRHVMLAVSDNGTGMDGATVARIFEPFFTTKEKGRGTGLGLSTVFGIVQQSQGSIWVYSEPGQGTTFKIYLPLAEGACAAASAEPAAKGPLEGTETIMLVEDEGLVRTFAREALTQLGYRVVSAADGSEALRLMDQHTGDIHLLVTDVVMPGMGGRQLAERLAARRPALKVLYMSGYTDNAIVHHGVLDAGLEFIQKPITMDSLSRKVREILDRNAG